MTMKAVVLAAGEGRRLRPLTALRPKPMLPVANRPILEHVIRALAEAGIEDICLVVGYRRDRIQDHFADGDQWGVDITYVAQEEQLGTGHALLQAEPMVGEDFIALNGDRIVEAALIEEMVARREETGDPVMAITESGTPSDYGVVEVSGQTVTGIEEQPVPELTQSSLINAGVYAFGPDIFAAIRRTETNGELGITDTLNAVREDHTLQAVPYRGRWLDISHPWDLTAVTATLLEGRSVERPASATVDETAVVADETALGDGTIVHPQATVLGGTALGDNVRIGPNSTVKNAVVLSDVTINAGTVLNDCVIGSNTDIGPGTVIEGGDADVVLDETVHRDVTFGGLVGDNTDVRGNVTVKPGAILGNDVTVDSGAVVSGRVDSKTVFTRG